MCGRLLRVHRGAFWSAGELYCMACVRKGLGDAPLDPLEEAMLRWLDETEEGKEAR